jgi:exosortase A-associated hydrolase 1
VIVREQAVVFECAGDRLLGIASIPEHPTNIGVLILTGGRQYRAGSHRQFTLLARRLASANYCMFRFDFRGMGDSEGRQRSFEMVDEDVAAAIAAFRQACPSVHRVVLFGLCDAATAAVLYWQRTRDPVASALGLVNPWARTETGHARVRVRHYYRERVFAIEFWKKLLHGDLRPLQSLRELLGNWRLARQSSEVRGFLQTMFDGLQSFPGQILLLLSGRDLTAREFVDAIADAGLGELMLKQNVCRIDLPGADHTFSDPAWRVEVEQACERWLSDKLMK